MGIILHFYHLTPISDSTLSGLNWPLRIKSMNYIVSIDFPTFCLGKFPFWFFSLICSLLTIHNLNYNLLFLPLLRCFIQIDIDMDFFIHFVVVPITIESTILNYTFWISCDDGNVKKREQPSESFQSFPRVTFCVPISFLSYPLKSFSPFDRSLSCFICSTCSWIIYQCEWLISSKTTTRQLLF